MEKRTVFITSFCDVYNNLIDAAKNFVQVETSLKKYF